MNTAYWIAIRAAIEWAAAGDNRRVDVDFKPDNIMTLDDDTKISIWCFDQSNSSGTYIKMEWFDPCNPVQSIENAINRKAEEKELDLFLKLKAKFEPSPVQYVAGEE